MKKGKYMDALLSLPLNYSLFIDMEKNKPINVALDDIRYKPEIINNLEYRFVFITIEQPKLIRNIRV